jgi:Icc-related predicted phosphoesterase
LRLCHISDTHGHLNPLQGFFDVIVHSGDFLPDPPGNPSFKDEIGLWQLDWVKDNIDSLKKWIGNYPFLFTLGNHDHVDPYDLEKLLRKNNIDANCLHDNIFKINDIGFYGFPFVPYINGSFAYERFEPYMQDEVNVLVEQVNAGKVNVLVCHAPPLNILDLSYSKHHLGSAIIASGLAKIKAKKLPSYYLCGHIHYSRGVMFKHNICFSNAACFQQILEI